MIRGLYSAASTMDAAALNHEVVAENLAYATMPGYRRAGVQFETFDAALTQSQANGAVTTNETVGVRPSGIYTHFDDGPLQNTGNRFDVAVGGNAFFVVDGPNGPLLTRNGAFRLNENNELQTAGGFLVRGEGGAIAIPPEASRIVIGLDGRIFADDAPIGRFQIVEVDDPSELERVGPTYFQGVDPDSQPEPENVRVQQGYLEGSNVQIVHEMVSMLMGLRQYQAADRAIRSISDNLALNTQPNE